MLNKIMTYPILAAALLSLLLIGYGDSKSFLGAESEISSLTAHPKVLTLKLGETQHVDLTKSLVANNVSRWELTDLDDRSGLGSIVRGDKTSFDYQARHVGAGYINYTVRSDYLTATSQIVLSVNADETAKLPNIEIQCLSGLN